MLTGAGAGATWRRSSLTTSYMTLVLTNARLVLHDQVLHGTVHIEAGRIANVQPGLSTLPCAQDLDGDYVLPGAVDLHTDNLERQVQPRPGARWPSRGALLAHDAHCAAAGITTVLDALCVGDLGFDQDRPRTCAEGVADITALAPTGLLKADHFLHLRCELPAPGMPGLLAQFTGHALLRLVSLMDHTPGTGQYANLDRSRDCAPHRGVAGATAPAPPGQSRRAAGDVAGADRARQPR